jgi:hypothetical protein
MTRTRRLVSAWLASALAACALAVPAFAANNSEQNGLVNVSVGDVSVLNNARIGVAAEVVAAVCGVKVGPIAVLATQVDASGTQQLACTAAGAPVTITQA